MSTHLAVQNGQTSATRICPCLWFDSRAEEAARFYTSFFNNSSLGRVSYYGKSGAAASGQLEGSVMTVTFTLDGHEFLGLNGGPMFQFSPAISFMVYCDSQDEIDWFWDKLSEGGAPSQCGWLTDKFGLSWQIVPRVIDEMMKSGDDSATERLMSALMKMQKLDLKVLTDAYENR